MNVSLPDDLADFVKDEASQGGYGSQSDVVREGLRMLREYSQRRSVLRALLAQGRDVADRAQMRAKKKKTR